MSFPDSKGLPTDPKGLLTVVVALLLAVMMGLPVGAAPAGAAGTQVTVAVPELVPFVMTKDNVRSGFTVDLLNEIALREGWTLDYLNVDSVDAQLRAVREGRADAAAGGVSITAERSKSFDFSQPTHTAGLQILVSRSRNDDLSPRIIDFFTVLFSRTALVWLVTGLLLAVVPAHIAWLLERRSEHPRMSTRYFPGIFEAFSWGMEMLTSQTVNFPRHWLNRILIILMAFVSLVFVAFYTATLTSNLTVHRLRTEILSPADLVGKNVCTVADTTSTQFLQRLGLSPETVKTISDCYPGLTDGTVDAVIFDSAVLSYYASHDGAKLVATAGPVFEHENYGIAFREGSPLSKQANDALLSMREDGTWDVITARWFGRDSLDSPTG